MKKIVAGIITTVLLLSSTFVFLINYKDGELIREAVSWLDRRQTFKRRFEEANQGVDYCQWLVGESYAYGNYVKQDHKEAVLLILNGTSRYFLREFYQKLLAV